MSQQQYHSHQYRTGQYHSGSSNSISRETGPTRANSGMTRSLVEMSGGVSGLQQPQHNVPMPISAQVHVQLKFILSIYSQSHINSINGVFARLHVPLAKLFEYLRVVRVKWSRRDIQSSGLLLPSDNKCTINTMFQRKSLLLCDLNVHDWLSILSVFAAWILVDNFYFVWMPLDN